MVWACDAKGGGLCGKESDGPGKCGGRKRGRPNRRWMDSVMDCRGRKCTIVLHGGVYCQTLTTHRSGNKINKTLVERELTVIVIDSLTCLELTSWTLPSS